MPFYAVFHLDLHYLLKYSKTCVKRPLSKRPQIGLQDQLLLHAGQKYCRMLQGEHSAIPLTFIKLSFVIKIFLLSILEWPFYTVFTVAMYQFPYKKINFCFDSFMSQSRVFQSCRDRSSRVKSVLCRG